MGSTPNCSKKPGSHLASPQPRADCYLGHRLFFPQNVDLCFTVGDGTVPMFMRERRSHIYFFRGTSLELVPSGGLCLELAQLLNVSTGQNPGEHVVLKTRPAKCVQFVDSFEEICLLVYAFTPASILWVVQSYRYVFSSNQSFIYGMWLSKSL